MHTRCIIDVDVSANAARSYHGTKRKILTRAFAGKVSILDTRFPRLFLEKICSEVSGLSFVVVVRDAKIAYRRWNLWKFAAMEESVISGLSVTG